MFPLVTWRCVLPIFQAGSTGVASTRHPARWSNERRKVTCEHRVTLCSRTVNKICGISLILVAILAAACGSGAPQATPASPTSQASSASPSATAPTIATFLLPCHARAVRGHPRDHTAVGIKVRTAARALVTATTAHSGLDGQSTSGRASAGGTLTLRFHVGGATAGTRIVIDVHVSRRGKRNSCHASFRPRSSPVLSRSPAPAPQPSTATSCYPLTNGGNCYEPGEFCRDSDHGVSGLAGDGKKITCENNDGWRWEPA
jgi:hypothetical protein